MTEKIFFFVVIIFLLCRLSSCLAPEGIQVSRVEMTLEKISTNPDGTRILHWVDYRGAQYDEEVPADNGSKVGAREYMLLKK